MKKTRNLLFVVLVMLLFWTLACVERATGPQIEEACQNLVKIYPAPDGRVEDQLDRCKQDLERERISASAAVCRAKASSTDDFWNRCR